MRRGGGRIQLVYTGKEDSFLTIKPSVSFFRFVYRRYTNFSMESIRMYFNGKPDFGQTFTCNIPKFGDLLGACFLVVDLPKLYLKDGTEVGYCNGVGHAMIDEIKFMCGEVEIDKQNGMIMNMLGNLTTSMDKRLGYQQMVGETYGNPTFSLLGGIRLHIPLNFWFNKTPGQFLPLLSLQYHQLQVRITFKPLKDLWYVVNGKYVDTCQTELVQSSLVNCELWGDFVFLENEERRRFVSQTHEYLIEQVQVIPPISIPAGTQQISLPLTLNHPIKELLWAFRLDANTANHEYFNFTSNGANAIGAQVDLMAEAILQIDGQDRFEKRPGQYFRCIQPYQYHTVNTSPLFIYMYSFALRPEELQPSGTLNASRFYDIVLQVKMNANNCLVPTLARSAVDGGITFFSFALNYNIFRIQEGYGGLLFSN